MACSRHEWWFHGSPKKLSLFSVKEKALVNLLFPSAPEIPLYSNYRRQNRVFVFILIIISQVPRKSDYDKSTVEDTRPVTWRSL